MNIKGSGAEDSKIKEDYDKLTGIGTTKLVLIAFVQVTLGVPTSST